MVCCWLFVLVWIVLGFACIGVELVGLVDLFVRLGVWFYCLVCWFDGFVWLFGCVFAIDLGFGLFGFNLIN